VITLDQPQTLAVGEVLDLGGDTLVRSALHAGVAGHGAVPRHGSVVRAGTLDGTASRVGGSAKAHGVAVGNLGAKDDRAIDRVVVDRVRVVGWQHAGVYVGHSAHVELRGLSGASGSAGQGAIVLAGVRSHARVRGCDVDHVNIEISANGDPTHVALGRTRCGYLGGQLRNAGSTLRLTDVEVTIRADLHTPVWVEAIRTTVEALDTRQPGDQTWRGCTIGPVELQFQTASRTVVEGQVVRLVDCTVGPIQVRGQGELHLTRTPAVITAVHHVAAGLPTAVMVYVAGEVAALLTDGDALEVP